MSAPLRVSRTSGHGGHVRVTEVTVSHVAHAQSRRCTSVVSTQHAVSRASVAARSGRRFVAWRVGDHLPICSVYLQEPTRAKEGRSGGRFVRRCGRSCAAHAVARSIAIVTVTVTVTVIAIAIAILVIAIVILVLVIALVIVILAIVILVLLVMIIAIVKWATLLFTWQVALCKLY